VVTTRQQVGPVRIGFRDEVVELAADDRLVFALGHGAAAVAGPARTGLR